MTLTNLGEGDWQRIEEQRLSPLFVSVHATEPDLRSRLLVNPRASQVMDQLAWFDQRDLQIHARVVACLGLNDGPALGERPTTWRLRVGLAAVWSAAVVPVGLTRFSRLKTALSLWIRLSSGRPGTDATALPGRIGHPLCLALG